RNSGPGKPLRVNETPIPLDRSLPRLYTVNPGVSARAHRRSWGPNREPALLAGRAGVRPPAFPGRRGRAARRGGRPDRQEAEEAEAAEGAAGVHGRRAAQGEEAQAPARRGRDAGPGAGEVGQAPEEGARRQERDGGPGPEALPEARTQRGRPARRGRD